MKSVTCRSANIAERTNLGASRLILGVFQQPQPLTDIASVITNDLANSISQNFKLPFVVQIEDLDARRLGVTGVPSFIVERRYEISGAQASKVFRRVFETVGRGDAAE